MDHEKMEIVAWMMKRIQDKLFPGKKCHEIDLVKLTNKDRLSMEDDLLTAFPNLKSDISRLAIRFKIPETEALEMFFVNSYILMIAYIRKEKMRWLDANKPELHDAIEKTKKLK